MPVTSVRTHTRLRRSGARPASPWAAAERSTSRNWPSSGKPRTLAEPRLRSLSSPSMRQSTAGNANRALEDAQNESGEALKKQTFDQLVALRDVKKRQIEQYFGECQYTCVRTSRVRRGGTPYGRTEGPLVGAPSSCVLGSRRPADRALSLFVESNHRA